MSDAGLASGLSAWLDLPPVVNALLLDFDGPVCSVFAGHPATDVAEEMRSVLRSLGADLPAELIGSMDPLYVLRWTADHRSDALSAVERVLDVGERRAVESARPTTGVDDAIAAISGTGARIAIVSNNSAAAIHTYLRIHGLAQFVDLVVGRPPGDPSGMKPDPGGLLRALASLGVPAAEAVFVGDTATDVQAAASANISFIGYARDDARAQRLAAAGARALMDTMTALPATVGVT